VLKHHNPEFKRIVKLGRAWVLVVVNAMLLLAGAAQADDCDDTSGLSTLQTLCRESAAEGSLFGARFRERSKELEIETSDANTPFGLGARLQLLFATLKGDPVKPDRQEPPGSSYAILRGGRIKLGEHPFLPWMEIYSVYDSKDKGFLSERQVHLTGIDDRFRGTTRRLRGGHFQVGYFFHEWWERVPPSLEIAGRVSLVEPETLTGSGLQDEWTLGANWFFRRHGNRIAADVSYIGIDHPDSVEYAMRFQVRWDIAF
jgi:hypothetical protein